MSRGTQADANEPFSALVFKIVTDPFMGRLAYVRVYSGRLKAGSMAYNVNRNRRERIGRLVQMYADKREEIQSVKLAILRDCRSEADLYRRDAL